MNQLPTMAGALFSIPARRRTYKSFRIRRQPINVTKATVCLRVYLNKRLWISKKVEEAVPETLQEIEHAAVGGLKDLKQEIKEKMRLKPRRRKRHRSKRSR